MCGIAGAIDLFCNENIAQTMLQTMHHRGPDGNGVFTSASCCLLHSRLAIIDLDGGNQPMELKWKNETYTIVYNGELYNTEQLRHLLCRLGHSFQGHSDTEVVLHAYAQWTDKCVEWFNGIFAFGVWEHKSKKLFLARDRIGVKPLFYKLHDGGILFASEIKTILGYPTVSAELDAEGVAQILLLGPGRIPGSGVFRGIKELEPGCCGYYCNRKLNWKRYWKLTDREHTDTFEDTVQKVRHLVTDSIRRQMVSDVPIGTFLSGGLDSSIISSICADELTHTDLRLPTFSVDYKDNEKYFIPGKFQPNSDNAYIQVMQSYLNSEHHWTVLTPEQLVGALEEATRARDLPGMADVDFSLLLFCGEIRSHVKVALSGECADEIFGGYPWYRDPQIRSQAGFPWAQNTYERIGFMSHDIQEKINGAEYVNDQYLTTLKQCDILPGCNETDRRMKEMVNLNHRWFMQTLLDRKDRMSMHHGLEVRVPFCDYRIAEYLYSVPWEFKDHNGMEKGLLRIAMADRLPGEVLNRKKSPYPKTHDPRYMRLVSDRLQDVLHDKHAPILQIVNKESLETLLTAQSDWPWYGQLMRTPQTIAYMLQINYWLAQYHISVI